MKLITIVYALSDVFINFLQIILDSSKTYVDTQFKYTFTMTNMIIDIGILLLGIVIRRIAVRLGWWINGNTPGNKVANIVRAEIGHDD